MATGTVIPPGVDIEEDEVLEPGGGTLSAIEEADRRSQVSIAKQYPRSITKFRQELTDIARASQSVAMEMMYSLPRAGKQLVGPSVRFAEALISCWGNARAGVEVVDVNTHDKCVVAEGRFFDCEKNVGIAVRTRRRNVTKKLDADSYDVTGAAASSIALRNAILRGVPKALWNDIFELAKKTAVGEAVSIDKTRADVVKHFNGLGVTSEKLYNALGVQGMADIGSDELLAMKAWQRQLESKEMSIEDIFGSAEDDEIERLMNQLGWGEAKKRQSRQGFGSKGEHLAYLRSEVQKMGGPAENPQPKQQQAAPPPEGESRRESELDRNPPKQEPVKQAAAPKPSNGKTDWANF